MKKIFLVFLLIFIFVLFQSTFPPLFSFPINPSFVFIFLSSVFLPTQQAVLPYIFGGIVLDFFSEKNFGFYTLTAILIFFLYLFIKKYVKI